VNPRLDPRLDQVEAEVLYIACIREVAVTPDTAERWVDFCRGRAELDLAARRD
jgi:hypothetical protein